MTNTYECMVLLDNREVRQGWEPLKERVSGMFTKSGGEVLSARLWAERRLAYPIKGQVRGTYLLVYYKADADANVTIRRDMELSEFVLRHFITVCEEIPEDAYTPEEEFDVNAIPEEGREAKPEPEPKAEASAEEGDGESEGDSEGESSEKAEGEGEASEGEGGEQAAEAGESTEENESSETEEAKS